MFVSYDHYAWSHLTQLRGICIVPLPVFERRLMHPFMRQKDLRLSTPAHADDVYPLHILRHEAHERRHIVMIPGSLNPIEC